MSLDTDPDDLARLRKRPPPMTVLQNRWYNGLIESLGLGQDSFQMFAPAPILAPADPALWSLENTIPRCSLTFDPVALPGLEFLAGYAPIAEAMCLPESSLEQALGPEVFLAWEGYLATIVPPPAAEELPALFGQWALFYAPDKLEVGVALLSEQALFAASRAALAPYLGPVGKPADFRGTSEELLALLAASPARSLSFDSAATGGGVASTWTGGIDAGVGGLFTGETHRSPISTKFAKARVTAQIQLAHFAVWVTVPGDWYDSGLFHLAYATATSPPWPASGEPNWPEAFGPLGLLPRLFGSLIAADGLKVELVSAATFELDEQEAILEQARFGLWPWYAPDRPGTVNQVSFDPMGGMKILTTIDPGQALILGANVFDIARYLGGGPASGSSSRQASEPSA